MLAPLPPTISLFYNISSPSTVSVPPNWREQSQCGLSREKTRVGTGTQPGSPPDGAPLQGLTFGGRGPLGRGKPLVNPSHRSECFPSSELKLVKLLPQDSILRRWRFHFRASPTRLSMFPHEREKWVPLGGVHSAYLYVMPLNDS